MPRQRKILGTSNEIVFHKKGQIMYTIPQMKKTVSTDHLESRVKISVPRLAFYAIIKLGTILPNFL